MDVTGPDRVELTIDTLTVEGLGPRDEVALAAAVERHLTGLLREQGPPPRWAADPADVVVELDWDGRGGDDALAATLARRIFGVLGS